MRTNLTPAWGVVVRGAAGVVVGVGAGGGWWELGRVEGDGVAGDGEARVAGEEGAEGLGPRDAGRAGEEDAQGREPDPLPGRGGEVRSDAVAPRGADACGGWPGGAGRRLAVCCADSGLDVFVRCSECGR